MADQLTSTKFTRYECKEGSHNKFYEILVISYYPEGQDKITSSSTPVKTEIYTAHGKIGQTPSIRLRLSTKSPYEASDEQKVIAREKIRKGYVIKSEFTGKKADEKINSILPGHKIIVEKHDKEEKVKAHEDKTGNRFYGLDE
jgi:hypothetical protein